MKFRYTFPDRVFLEKLQISNKTDAASPHMAQMAHRMFLLEGETSAINVNRDTHTQTGEGAGVRLLGWGSLVVRVRVCVRPQRAPHNAHVCKVLMWIYDALRGHVAIGYGYDEDAAAAGGAGGATRCRRGFEILHFF